jgi:predicted amidohydrolase YtcJ
VRINGHATWMNCAALRAAGIERATRDPDGGLIARDARGEPTGLLVDTAQPLLHAVEPRPTDEQFDRAVMAASRSARSSSWPTARSARAAPRCTNPTATIPATPASC